jgi:hypothetical protein
MNDMRYKPDGHSLNSLFAEEVIRASRQPARPKSCATPPYAARRIAPLKELSGFSLVDRAARQVLFHHQNSSKGLSL